MIKVDIDKLVSILNDKEKIEDCFFNSPFKSIKHNSYLLAYEKLFSEYVGKNYIC